MNNKFHKQFKIDHTVSNDLVSWTLMLRDLLPLDLIYKVHVNDYTTKNKTRVCCSNRENMYFSSLKLTSNTAFEKTFQIIPSIKEDV